MFAKNDRVKYTRDYIEENFDRHDHLSAARWRGTVIENTLGGRVKVDSDEGEESYWEWYLEFAED